VCRQPRSGVAESSACRVLLFEANLAHLQLAKLFGCRPPVCITDQLERLRREESGRWDVVEVPDLGRRIHLGVRILIASMHSP